MKQQSPSKRTAPPARRLAEAAGGPARPGWRRVRQGRTVRPRRPGSGLVKPDGRHTAFVGRGLRWRLGCVWPDPIGGNLLSDGRWLYTWDAENRLVAMETTEAAVAAGVPKQRLVFAYDWQGRRIRKQVFAWVNGGWQLTTDHRFVYDGWNLIAVLSPQSSVLQSFVWGLDLSGTLQRAGGVGGLLMANSCFVAYDGNGNVVALVDAPSSMLLAQYEYGPFGEPIRATGPLAEANPFRFSTKYHDPETDLLYYGYRYYNPTLGRWLSRDPVGPKGGRNLYNFAGNSLGVDWLGLLPCCVCLKDPSKCWIDVEWVDGNLVLDFYFFANIQPPEGPGRFLMQMGAKIILRHAGWLSLEGCHLRQDTQGQSSFPVNGRTAWETLEDYSSAKSAGWPSYGGWYFYDRPRVDTAFDSLPAEPQTYWWQAHVTVEEAPSVETWWGFAGTAVYTGGQAKDQEWGATRWAGTKRSPFSVVPGTRIQ